MKLFFRKELTDKIPFDMDNESTILELKEMASEKTGVAQPRLVTSSGKVLQPDEALLSSFNISNETIIYVTKAPQPSTASTSPIRPVSAANPASPFPPGLADSPMTQVMLNNPELLSSIMQSSPQVQNMLRDNPEAAQLFRDPEVRCKIDSVSPTATSSGIKPKTYAGATAKPRSNDFQHWYGFILIQNRYPEALMLYHPSFEA